MLFYTLNGVNSVTSCIKEEIKSIAFMVPFAIKNESKKLSRFIARLKIHTHQHYFL